MAVIASVTTSVPVSISQTRGIIALEKQHVALFHKQVFGRVSPRIYRSINLCGINAQADDQPVDTTAVKGTVTNNAHSLSSTRSKAAPTRPRLNHQ